MKLAESRFSAKYLLTNVHGDVWAAAQTVSEVKQYLKNSGLTRVVVFERKYEVFLDHEVRVEFKDQAGQTLVI